ncbi:MAG: response regulator [Solirubrobacteraceae bacterium]
MSTVSISPHRSQRNVSRQTRLVAERRADGVDVLIVDDQPWAIPRVSSTPGCKRQIRVIATAESSDEALRMATELKPDVCMVSATLEDWLRLAPRLKQLDEPPRTLIYGAAADSRVIGAAIIAETDGLLRRYVGPEELADIIRRVSSGAKPFPSLQPEQCHELLDCVDDRDRAIVAMLLERVPADYVASTLGLSARSLRVRRQAILTRLDAGRGSENDRPRQTR